MGTIADRVKTAKREEYSYKKMLSYGWTPEQASGIVGNLKYESNLETTREGDIGNKGGSSFGVAQFRGNRLQKLKSMYGDGWKDLDNQLEFVNWELNNTHKKAGDRLRQVKGVYNTGRVMSDDYEIPAKKWNSNDDRQRAVFDIHQKYSGVVLTEEDRASFNRKKDTPPSFTNFEMEENRGNLATVPDVEEKPEVVEAIKTLDSKQNEENFLKSMFSKEQEDFTVPEPKKVVAQQIAPTNIMETYDKIDSFVEAQQGGAIRFLKQKVQPREEKFTVQRDATTTQRNNTRSIQQLNVKNKTDKEIATEREAKIQASVEAQKTPYTKENWRRQLAVETATTGDKLRVSNEPNFFDDYINPAVMVGNMASNLGQSPLQAEQLDSILPYVTSVGTPLTVGALAGLGTQSTGQFVNNLANPLAGTGDLVNNLGSKYLPNAYKYNPAAKGNVFNKFSEDSFLRQIDDTTYREGLESGLIRGKQDIDMTRGEEIININKSFGDDAYYKKGSPYYPNQQNYPFMYEVRKGEEAFIPKVNGRTRKYTTDNTNIRVSKEPIPLDEADVYKHNWLRGYEKLQQGGAIERDKEWLQNWYGNRVIPNKDINDIYQKSKSEYEDLSHAIPNPIYKGFIPSGEGITDLTSQAVHTKDNEIMMVSPENETTFTHEADHFIYTNANAQDMNDVHNNVVKYNLAPQENIRNPNIKSNYQYYSTPTEVHSRVQEFRKKAGFKPNQELKKEDIDRFKKTYKGGTEGINDLFDMTDTEHLLEIMNNMADNNKRKPNNLAQQGGIISDNQGQWKHPGDVTKIDGGNITMKGVNYPVLGVSNLGEQKMMYPNKDYQFQGAESVTEYPQLTEKEKNFIKAVQKYKNNER